MEFKSFLFPCICLCFIFIENSSAGISTKNTTEFQHKVQKKPQKFRITQRQISQGVDFAGRTWDLLVGGLTSSLNATASSSKNISSLTSSLPSLSSFTTSGITSGFGNQVAQIPLYIGLPVLIIGLAILIKAIALIVAYIPGYTAPIYNKFVEEYGDYFQFDDDDDSSGGYGQEQSHGWQSPSNSYGTPQSDSYSNSRITYVQTPQQSTYNYNYQRPGPSSEQISTASHQLSQAVNKYSQI